MSKIQFKAGNMIYPLPAVMVSCGSTSENYNILTIAWTGTICTNPPMCYISVRPERHSYELIKNSGEFVINLSNKELAKATDWCGVRSGEKFDKFKEMGLTPGKAKMIGAPTIEEAPVNIECKVKDIVKLGSHDMFIADVVNVLVDEKYMDEKGAFKLGDAGLINYSHGNYYEQGLPIGKFGYSVQKKKK